MTIHEFLWWAMLGVLILLIGPIILYITVQLVTLSYYRAKEHYFNEKNNHHKGDRNGSIET